VDDAGVLAAVAGPAAAHPQIWAVTLVAGDPHARGIGPEVIVRLAIEPGLDAEALRSIIAAVSEAWAHDATVAARIDSLSVQPIAASSETGRDQPGAAEPA
ncbi:MAG: hypothetical protein Q7J04_04740, partial [Microcella sp.]|nr:hypothetical protein [Microcella sp.]